MFGRDQAIGTSPEVWGCVDEEIGFLGAPGIRAWFSSEKRASKLFRGSSIFSIKLSRLGGMTGSLKVTGCESGKKRWNWVLGAVAEWEKC